MGAALSPEAAAAVRAAELRDRPSVHLLPVDRGRRCFAEESAPMGAVPEVDRVEDVVLPGGPRVRLYRPDDRPGDRADTDGLPVVVFLHGGGWVLGDLDTHDLMCRTLVVESGCALVAVDYRRAPEDPFPAAVDDAEAALRWISESGPAYGLDPERVAVVGDSAGGNLALALGLRAAGRRPGLRLQVLFYPVTTTDLGLGVDPEYDGLVLARDELAWHQDLYLPAPADRRSPEASPLDRADLTGLPPALVIAAECDPIHPQSGVLADALTEAGVPARLRVFEGAIHGFAQWPDRFAAAREALTEAGAALARALAGPGRGAADEQHHPHQEFSM